MGWVANEKSQYNSIAVASVLKICGSELQQKVAELQLEALGPKTLYHFTEHELENPDTDPPGMEAYVAGRTAEYMIARAATIYGGSQQVQKTVISKLAFGL